MKKYFAALSATALISIAPYALAASSTDLTVTGTITPVACEPSLSGGGIVDLGKISSQDLNSDRNTLVGTHPMQLNVVCDAAALFALEAIDNREGTSIGDHFGLGLTPDDEELGFFYLKIERAVADTQTVLPIGSSDGGVTWAAQNDIQKGKWSSVAATGAPTTQIPVTNLVMDLQIDTYIAQSDSLTLDDEVTIDGSATIEVKYM